MKMWTDVAEKTLAEYRKKGLAARAGFGVSPAVIVIDAIVGFTDTASPLGAPFEKEIAATVTLLDAARRTGTPVILTTVAYDPGCEEALVFMCKMPSLRILEAGSRW